jgi:hypothetical protein
MQPPIYRAPLSPTMPGLYQTLFKKALDTQDSLKIQSSCQVSI